MNAGVEMRHISKRFDAVQALSNVSLDLRPGEVHTVAGENGSGKSTLLKILGGVIRPDKGEILVAGATKEFHSVRDAMRYGVTMVSQELSLIPNLGIAENIFIGHNQSRNKFGIDWKDTDRRALEILERLNISVDPRREVSTLPQHEQQLVEIARALSFNAKVLLLDEPTSSLAPNEVEALFKVVRQLREDGVAVVLITHRMSEMLEISDRFTVLRDGKFIDTSDRSGIDENWLIERMVINKPKASARRNYSAVGKRPVLEVKGLSDRAGAYRDISFEVREGEIVGLAGLAGAGRTELVETLSGVRQRKAGSVFINGRKAGNNSRTALASGIALVPDDRREKSTIHEMSVRDNLMLSQHKFELKHRSKRNEERIVGNWIDKFSIKASGADALIKSLSGGNQQKVVIARCLQTNPKILILDEATRGVDLGAKAEIYEILRKLADEGLSILLVSSEISEIFEISDRILVMHAGELSANLDRSKTSEAEVVAAATGVK
jgi:rhamnose transport system ATP-binding protein